MGLQFLSTLLSSPFFLDKSNNAFVDKSPQRSRQVINFEKPLYSDAARFF